MLSTKRKKNYAFQLEGYISSPNFVHKNETKLIAIKRAGESREMIQELSSTTPLAQLREMLTLLQL